MFTVEQSGPVCALKRAATGSVPRPISRHPWQQDVEGRAFAETMLHAQLAPVGPHCQAQAWPRLCGLQSTGPMRGGMFKCNGWMDEGKFSRPQLTRECGSN